MGGTIVGVEKLFCSFEGDSWGAGVCGILFFFSFASGGIKVRSSLAECIWIHLGDFG